MGEATVHKPAPKKDPIKDLVVSNLTGPFARLSYSIEPNAAFADEFDTIRIVSPDLSRALSIVPTTVRVDF